MEKSKPFYTQIDHTADLRIRVHGKDPKDLFGNAARALIDLMFADTIAEKTAVTEVTVEGKDFGDLMVRWLGEILYLFEGEGVVASSFDIHELAPKRLRATVRSVPFDPEIREILADIKGVTYHEIAVGPKGGRWEAEVTFDV